MSAQLAGRRARWQQLGMDSFGLTLSVLSEVLELKLSGFPSDFLFGRWRAQGEHLLETRLALAIVPIVYANTPIQEIANILSNHTEHTGSSISRTLSPDALLSFSPSPSTTALQTRDDLGTSSKLHLDVPSRT